MTSKNSSTIFDEHSAIMLLLEPETGIILDANQSATVFYKDSRLKICGMPYSKINASPPKHVKECKKVVAGKKNFFVSSHILANGERHIVESYSSPVILRNKQALLVIIHDITGHKNVEQTLNVSEQFIYATIDALPSHICIFNKAGRILHVNQAWRNFAQLNSSSDNGLVEGVNYFNVCDTALVPDAETAKLFVEGIRKVIRREFSEFSLEYPCHSPDEQRWFMGKVTLFHQQKPVRVVVTHENITRIKLTEEFLRESKRLLQAVLQSTRGGILVKTSENKVIFVTGRFYSEIPKTS
jgi:PAS domain-containing protein